MDPPPAFWEDYSQQYDAGLGGRIGNAGVSAGSSSGFGKFLDSSEGMSAAGTLPPRMREPWEKAPAQLQAGGQKMSDRSTRRSQMGRQKFNATFQTNAVVTEEIEKDLGRMVRMPSGQMPRPVPTEPGISPQQMAESLPLVPLATTLANIPPWQPQHGPAENAYASLAQHLPKVSVRASVVAAASAAAERGEEDINRFQRRRMAASQIAYEAELKQAELHKEQRLDLEHMFRVMGHKKEEFGPLLVAFYGSKAEERQKLLRQYDTWRHDAARKIQAMYHIKKARDYMNVLMKQRNLEREERKTAKMVFKNEARRLSLQRHEQEWEEEREAERERKFQEAEEVRKQQEIRQQEAAATKIQGLWRGRKQRHDFESMRSEKNAQKAEALARKYEEARRRSQEFRTQKRLVEERERFEEDQRRFQERQRLEKDQELRIAATKIQATFRGNRERRDVQERRQQRRDLEERRQADRMLRKEEARRRSLERRAHEAARHQSVLLREEEERQRVAAAAKIQATYRGRVARRDFGEKKNMKNEKDFQRKMRNEDKRRRSLERREEARRLEEESRQREAAALKIQATRRGQLGRRRHADKNQRRVSLNARKEMEASAEARRRREAIEQEKSAMKIQAIRRGQVARRQVGGRRAQLQEEEEARRLESERVKQAEARRRSREQKRLREEAEKRRRLEREEEAAHAAATKLQSVWRGRTHRGMVAERRQLRREAEEARQREEEARKQERRERYADINYLYGFAHLAKFGWFKISAFSWLVTC